MKKKKKHILLAKMTCLASFQPVFVVAAKPTPPHPFKALIEPK